jgi:Spondin-like TSP1 domain/Thrombospondin type 1 domain
MAYVSDNHIYIPKGVASQYLTTGKRYPKENPECAQYYAKIPSKNRAGGCTFAFQSEKIRRATGGDFYPITPIRHGKSKNAQDQWVATYDKPYTYGGALSTTLSDNKWPKDMGETGTGLAGYEACERLCTDNDKCSAFESARPVGKTYNPTTGVLEDDPNSKFRCILWSGVEGDYEGAAIVNDKDHHGYNKNLDKTGICWTKKCQDDMRYAVPQYAGGTITGNKTTATQAQTINQTPSTLYVQSTTGFANSGKLSIRGVSGPYEVYYTGKTPTTFTGCTAKVLTGYKDYVTTYVSSPVTDGSNESHTWDNSYANSGTYPRNDDNDVYETTLTGRRGRDVIETELGLADWVYEQGPVGQQRKKRDEEEKYCCGWSRNGIEYSQVGGDPDVDCQYSTWSAWSDCDCDTSKTRTRSIVQQSQGNGTPCSNNSLYQSQTCLEKCDRDCEMADWTDWTECSEPCGTGTQIRSRYVRTPAANNGEACSDNILESRVCNTETCPGGEPPNPVNCRTSPWTGWGNCTKTCGGGTQTRTRVIEQEPMNGGTECPNLTESQPCNEDECVDPNPPSPKIDCKMSNWSNWGECSKTCGSGTQTRSRTIDTLPENEGAECPPNLTENQECNRQSCTDDKEIEEEEDNSFRNMAIIGGVVLLLCSFFMMFLFIALK